MADQRTTHLNLQVPDEGNLTNEDFVRLRQALQALDGILNSMTSDIDGRSLTGHDHAIAEVQGLQGNLDSLDTAIQALQSPTLDALDDTNVSAAQDGHVLLRISGAWQAATLAAANVSYDGTNVAARLGTMQGDLDGKASSGHGHSIAGVTGLQAALDGKASTADLATKANTSHSHAIGNVTGLQGALDGLQTNINGKLSTTGTATNADRVDNLHAASFVRADADDNVTGHTEWQDGKHVRVGNSADGRYYHSGGHTFLENHTGHFYIKSMQHSSTHGVYIQDEDSAGTNHNCAIFEHDRVLLYYDNAAKLVTDGSGAYVEGRLWAKAGAGLYVGNDGNGDSWAQFYDDNSNTWRFNGWDDSQNSFVLEENDGGTHKVALVETTSSTGHTSFPIGHPIIASYDSSAPDRNVSRALYLYTGNNDQYVDSSAAASTKGAQLSGTWRASGVSGSGTAQYRKVA